MTRVRTAYLVTVVAILAPMVADADIITFDGQEVFLCNEFDLTCPYTYTENGFDITTGTVGQYWILRDGVGSLSNGSDYLFGQNGHSFDIAASDGSAFSLNQFDAGQSFGDLGGVLNIVGTYAGGGTVSVSVNLLSGIYTTVTFDALWSGLSSVTLSQVLGVGYGNSNFLGIDNIVVNATSVPEPGTLALLGIGLAGIGLARRKRKI